MKQVKEFYKTTATILNVAEWQIKNSIELIDDGATIPFIARYRKERTGELTDIILLELQKLYEKHIVLEDRKKAILKSITDQGFLNDDLKNKIAAASTLAEAEDIYLPYKPKRKTRAVMAREKGLEPLAKMIMSENNNDITSSASKFVNKNVADTNEAIAGARDIIAEWVSEYGWVRNKLRQQFEKYAIITSTLIKGKEEEGEKYSSWFDWSENALKAPSHRILAFFRGEKESILKIKISPDKEHSIEMICSKLIKLDNECSHHKELAITDSISRLIFPSLETEVRNIIKDKADEASIKVFGNNLKQLLMSPPLYNKNVLAIDPGFRTGCKIVCLDHNGKLLHNDTIYPHQPKNLTIMAMKKISNLVDSYDIDAIAIGNGTAGRETEQLIERMKFGKDVIAISVNEDGASIYSASSIAREEFPEYDITVRGAVSIGRRLIDPLAELVKIDPKSIGVGQYQHDVNQKFLKDRLKSTVELCVNKVGVDLNTASKELLTYISGLGPKLALQIVEYRNNNDDFSSRKDILKVSGLGKKAYEQSAGFLKIKNGTNILDTTSVHPEKYHIVEKIARKQGCSVEDLISNKSMRTGIILDNFVDEITGLATLKDIMTELEKPGRDPREKFSIFKFDSTISSIKDVKTGMILSGIVNNITDFGAFVNLGIKESGLLHKSQIANEYVKNPADYLQINQQLRVRIIEVDLQRKRIGLSLKEV